MIVSTHLGSWFCALMWDGLSHARAHIHACMHNYAHTYTHTHTHIHTQMYIHAHTHTHTHTHTHGCTCLFFVPIFTMCQLFRASLCAHHLFCFLQTATALAAAVGWGEAPRAAVSKAWSHVRPYFAPSHTLSSLSFGLALMFDSSSSSSSSSVSGLDLLPTLCSWATLEHSVYSVKKLLYFRANECL